MINIIEPIASVFTGKGGALKLTITLSTVAAFFYEMMDAGYLFKGQTKDGSISVSPAGNSTTPISSARDRSYAPARIDNGVQPDQEEHVEANG